jgi:TPR repeat protein
MRASWCLSLCLWLATAAASAADIGGWMQHKSQIETQQRDDCIEIIAIAARTPREHDTAAAAYYASGMCYLVSDKVARDTTAAGAWLTRAAELEHPLARRALIALRESNAAPTLHRTGYHCHELGMGRRLCHGGPVLQ